MNDFSESKATIIGMGFLMEYIFPCFRACMGSSLSVAVNAVTVDETDLEEKRRRLGIKIQLGDNLKALHDIEPDLIFFSPPPSVAPELTEDILTSYYRERREKGKPLPILLAFPPRPAGAYYLEKLGEDIKVVNIIPNMISEVGDLPVSDEACNLFTFPEQDNWTADDKEALRAFFSPMGHCLEIGPSMILQALSTEMSAHPVTELANVSAEAFNEIGITCTYSDTASALRAHHRDRTGFAIKADFPCRLDALHNQAAGELLFKVWDSWYDASASFLIEKGLGKADTDRLLEPRYALFCLEAQVETREAIIEHARKDATKGGMLELFMQSYFSVIEPLLRELFLKCGNTESDCFEIDEVGVLMRFIISAVIERGKGLNRGTDIVFSPKHQAIMFGVLAKFILELYGQEKGESLLFKAVECYGNERGSRMAQRAVKNGDSLDMTTYFAYTEWSWQEGFAKSVEQSEPYYIHHVYACPWCDGWNESGLEKYGKYYCRNVDSALVKGFNPALTLEMKSWISDPVYDSCEFHWYDACMSPDNSERQRRTAERIGNTCKKDFIFHTAHLYATVIKCALEENAEIGKQLIIEAREAFANLTSYQELLLVLAQARTDFSKA